jgi:hypothetical protein
MAEENWPGARTARVQEASSRRECSHIWRISHRHCCYTLCWRHQDDL